MEGSREYALALARASAGAVLFAFPLLMTMEMWFLGFYMDRYRLALFLVLNLPLLIGLSYYAGFERTADWRDDVLDALSALAVGFVASAAMLGLFGVLKPGMPLQEAVGKIALQAVPASMGAMLARKQLAGDGGGGEGREEAASYGGELFLMTVGAIFVGFNVAPTEEIALIAFQMTSWHAVLLALASLLALHALVYTVGFGGQESRGGHGLVSVFLRFTLVGYGIALIVSLYVLWTFGRIDGAGISTTAMTVVVLAFPAALGAATARLIV
jgi:putative integral membrane protein (TIGR02587 family)